MTLWQFLNEAGFWTWIGLIILVSELAKFRPITINRCENKDSP